MKTGILYFTTCFHGFGILRHVDPFVRMLHIYGLYCRIVHRLLAFHRSDNATLKWLLLFLLISSTKTALNNTSGYEISI